MRTPHVHRKLQLKFHEQEHLKFDVVRTVQFDVMRTVDAQETVELLDVWPGLAVSPLENKRTHN